MPLLTSKTLLPFFIITALSLTACQQAIKPAPTEATNGQTMITQPIPTHTATASGALLADTSMIPMDAPNIVINNLPAQNTNPNANLNSNLNDNTLGNQFIKGTPEATVMQALNTLYYSEILGDSNAPDALSYFDSNTPNLAQKLAKFQPILQQYVRQVVLTQADYNEDNTQVAIQAQVEISISSQPKGAIFTLQKDAQDTWKIATWQLAK